LKLSKGQFDVLVKIARKTGCDCWFQIYQDENGDDYVRDIENGKDIPLRRGIEELCEGMAYTPEEYGLTFKESDEFYRLRKELCIGGDV